MRFALAAAASVALLAASPPGRAGGFAAGASSPGTATRPAPAALVLKGLSRAVAAGKLTREEARGYRAIVVRARTELRRLPPLRRDVLTAVLGDVAAQWRSYTSPRALTLVQTLAVDAHYLSGHRVADAHPDIAGDDGAVYRWFAGHGYVFHPLANFAKLDTNAATGDLDGASALAAALLARAIPEGNALLWEYEFPYGGGRPPWTSGMAQAVAAQALARAGDLLADPALLDAADRAYASVPGLLSSSSPASPWIALYSFDRTPVLNAQLQAALSVADYAAITGNPAGADLAARLTDAARRLLPSFDTGYWSLYSLHGTESPLDYHDYVIFLLRTLATRTGDAAWRAAADRFHDYETQPPVIRLGAPPPTLFPLPADGYRDEAEIRFWLSKRSTVTLQVAGERDVETLSHGEHTLVWRPGSASPGAYHPILTAVGITGPETKELLTPILVKHALGRPRVRVKVTGRATISWQSDDQGTPWLELQVRLQRHGQHRTLDLGQRGLAGRRRLKRPAGRWHATLVAVNSAGTSRSLSLGTLPR
jgi:hypothetical protein